MTLHRHLFAIAIAKIPEPQPKSNANSKFFRLSPSKAKRQPNVDPWFPVTNAAPAGIFNAILENGIFFSEFEL